MIPATNARISKNLDEIVALVGGIIRDLYRLERLRIQARELLGGSPPSSSPDPLALRVVARHLAMGDGVLFEADEEADIAKRDRLRTVADRVRDLAEHLAGDPNVDVDTILDVLSDIADEAER